MLIHDSSQSSAVMCANHSFQLKNAVHSILLYREQQKLENANHVQSPEDLNTSIEMK